MISEETIQVEPREIERRRTHESDLRVMEDRQPTGYEVQVSDR